MSKRGFSLRLLLLWGIFQFSIFVWGLGLCLWIWGSHDTVFAAGYKERVFDLVLLGATQNEVIDRLGEPLSREAYEGDRTRPYREFLCYSAPATDGSYLRRYIIIGRSGTVVAKISDLYQD